MTKKERKAIANAKYRATPQGKKTRAIHAARWRSANKERIAAYDAERNAVPEIKKRKAERRWLAKYDLLPVEYYFMLAGQDFRCAICKTDDPGRNDWHVDHCHTTGKVRGILCNNCNTGIGKLGDNAAGLGRALAYLERFECQTTSTKPTSETAGPLKASPPTEQSAKPRPSLRLVSSSQNFVGQSRKSA